MREYINRCVLAVCAVLVLSGCAEDRTYQYEEKTEGARWIETTMQEWYLWTDTVPKLSWKDYFLRGEAFLKRLKTVMNPADKWSYCAVDTLVADYHVRGTYDHVKSYGMDVVLMTDPTGVTSRQYGRVVTVYEDSPAERCGIRRNDFIAAINGKKVTSSNISNLVNGLTRTLAVSRIVYDEEQQMFLWTDTDTLTLTPSEYVEDRAFPLDSVYEVGGLKVGYVMCNRLVADAKELGVADGRYRVALDGIMSDFKSAGVGALIVDLRLCNYGELDMVSRMAAYIAGRGGQTLLKTHWKEAKSNRNEDVMFDAAVANNTLGLERVYFITSAYTCGAAEWLVHGLKGVLGDDNVFCIGTKTAGQGVMTSPFTSEEHSITLHLATAYVTDAEDVPCAGIEPDEVVDELGFAELLPYGDVNEVLLGTTLEGVRAVEGVF